MNRKLVILAAVLTAFLLSGCGAGKEVNKRAFVQIMGIDRASELYTVSLQIFQPSGNGTPDTSKENSVCISGEGSTLDSAIFSCETQYGKKVFLGHLKSVVIGGGIEDPAEELSSLIELKSDFGTIPLSCPVFISSNPYEITSLMPKQGLYSAEHITELIEIGADLGETFYSPIYDIITAGLHPMGNAAIPIIRSENEEAAFGGAVIADSSLYDKSFDKKELKGYILLSDRFKKGSKILTETSEGITAGIVGSKSCIKAENSDGKLKIAAEISLKLDIPPSCTDKHRAANDVCAAVRDYCFSAYSKSAWESGTDIFDIYSAARRYCPELLEGSDYSELLKTSVFSVKVSAKSY